MPPKIRDAAFRRRAEQQRDRRDQIERGERQTRTEAYDRNKRLATKVQLRRGDWVDWA